MFEMIASFLRNSNKTNPKRQTCGFEYVSIDTIKKSLVTLSFFTRALKQRRSKQKNEKCTGKDDQKRKKRFLI